MSVALGMGTGLFGDAPPPAPAGPWIPAGITTNLIQALDADFYVTSSGGLVSDWGDASGKGNNISQGTSGNRPTLVSNYVNGHAAILGGSSKSLYSPRSTFLGGTASLTAGYTRLFVFRTPAAWASNKFLAGYASGGQTGTWVYTTGGAKFEITAGTQAAVSPSKWYAALIVRSSGGPSTYRLKGHGVADTTGSGNPGDATMSNLTLFSYEPNQFQNFDGHIAYYGLWNGAFTTEQQSAVFADTLTHFGIVPS